MLPGQLLPPIRPQALVRSPALPLQAHTHLPPAHPPLFVRDHTCFTATLCRLTQLLLRRRHAASPNVSDMERQVVFVGYSYRWMKARDAMFVEPALERTSCPITRQLLGAWSKPSNSGHQPAAVVHR